VLVLCLVGLIAWLLAYFGPWLDDIDAATTSAITAADAERQAQAEFHKDLAAAKLCRETVGESLVSWNADGELVCIPRGYIKRRNQLASN